MPPTAARWRLFLFLLSIAGTVFPLHAADPSAPAAPVRSVSFAARLPDIDHSLPTGSSAPPTPTDPLPVSEDFGSFGTEWGVPSVFWYVGGTDPALYRRAEKAGRIAEDVPTNHSSKFAPVLHPTLEAGVEAITTATLSYVGR